MNTTPTSAAPDSRNGAFRLGAWLIQPGRNLIAGEAGQTRVEPMLMQVLLCLAASPGETLSRETLNQRVWGGRIVSDKVLTRAISGLRKALGDDPRRPAYIETVSKSGYRLLVPPIHPDQREPGPKPAAAGTTPSDTSPKESRRDRSPKRLPVLYPILAILILAAAILGVWVAPGRSERRTVDPVAPALPVTSFQGHELRPRLSPGGDRFVYAWRGEADDNWDIYLQHVHNGEPHRLTSDRGIEVSPAWSPDGSQVAYFRFGEKTCGLYVQSVPGGTPQKVKDCFRFSAEDIAQVAPRPAWSPDGTLLVFPAGGGNGRLRIVQVALADGETGFATDPPEGSLGDLDPAFSPDGRWLAVCRVRNWSDRDLVLVDRQNGTEHQVTSDGCTILGHDWTADGEHLIFSSNRQGTYALWQVGRNGGEPRWVPEPGGYLKYPSLARSSTALIYESWQYDTNIWWHARDASLAPEKRVASTRWDFQPDFDDAGGRIAFISNRSGAFEIWCSDADGRHAQRLTDLGNAGVPGAPRWSPGGDALVFHLWRHGDADLYLWRRDSGPARPFHSSPADEIFGDWSPDGRWLYFTTNREDGWQIWRMPVAGGEAQRLTRQGGYYSVPTAQGVIFTRERDSGVYRMAAAGGDAEHLFDLAFPSDWGLLAPCDGGLFFVQRDATGDAQLAHYDLATGAVSRLRSLGRKLPFSEPSMTASRDGAWVLLSQIDQTENDIFFANSFAVPAEESRVR